MKMKLIAVSAMLLLLLGIFLVRPPLIHTAKGAQESPSAAQQTDNVNVTMRNVDFRFADKIVVHIATLDGKLVSAPGQIAVFDDKTSFHLDLDSASITVDTSNLANDLNDYVFAAADAPLKKLTVATVGDQLVIKGLLARKGDVQFETDGTIAATPEGLIRLHTVKIMALHLPVKGLMDLIGVDIDNLISTKKIQGVTVDKDDLLLDPDVIFPPPKIQGRLTSIRLGAGSLSLQFGAPSPQNRQSPAAGGCGGSNFLYFKGGVVRFGKLTMNDTDLSLVDSAPSDPFDFSIDHYKDQLTAGYAKVTRQGGLCVHMPDFAKITADRKS